MKVSLSTSGGSTNLVGTVTLTAAVTPATQVTRVEFYVDGVLKATDTATPFTYSWNTTLVADGTHQLKARAYYERNKVEEGNLTVTVKNNAPPPPPPPVQDPPANTSLPVLSGTATEGQTLACSTGTWTNSPTGYSYQWLRCDAAGANAVAIPGAVSNMYVLTSADVTKTIRCAVTASNSVGISAQAITAQTAAVAALTPAVPVNTSLPTISGQTTRGYTLTSSTGSWTNSPTSYSYQWKRCDSAGGACVNISGETAMTYVLTTTDVGKTIRCAVVATNATGAGTAAQSAATALVADPPPPSTTWPANYYAGPAGNNNILPPKQGVLTGIWDSGGTGTDKIKAREAQVGRLFDLGTASYTPDYAVNADGKLTLIKNEGRIPVCSMHSNHTVAQVNSGTEDAWHTAAANAVKALAVPTFVRLFHEFNGSNGIVNGVDTGWMPYFTPGNTAADGQAFITAWRRVVSLWKNAGATNACFIWHTAGNNGLNGYYRYPGDAWVDWIAGSNYTYTANQWVGFYQDYADLWQLLGWAREYRVSDPNRYNNLDYKPFMDIFNKPYMIGEMGHLEDPRKASWFRNTKANLLGTFEPSKENGAFSNVLGMLYSDYGKEADPNGEYWTIDRPADGLSGFRDMVLDPYFRPRN